MMRVTHRYLPIKTGPLLKIISAALEKVGKERCSSVIQRLEHLSWECYLGFYLFSSNKYFILNNPKANVEKANLLSKITAPAAVHFVPVLVHLKHSSLH